MKPIAAAAAAADGSAASSRRNTGGFRLPEGWRVEEVPRTTSSTVDKFYFEPVTGQKFRSLKAVERYLNAEDVQFVEKPALPSGNGGKKRSVASSLGCSKKVIIVEGKMVSYMEGMAETEVASLAASETAARSHYDLPDGWIVEEVPRRDGSHSDKYYYEPGSGRKFRSLPAAKRHLAASSADPESDRPQAQSPNKQASSSDQIPEKVKWVPDSSPTHTWKPFVGGQAVPDAVSKEWSDRFHLAMQRGSS